MPTAAPALHSGTRGGDLGPFGRGMMQKPFEDATYVSDVAIYYSSRPHSPCCSFT